MQQERDVNVGLSNPLYAVFTGACNTAEQKRVEAIEAIGKLPYKDLSRSKSLRVLWIYIIDRKYLNSSK